MSTICTPELVIQTLHEKVGVPLDTPRLADASWDELGVESLGLSEAFASLEQTLGIEIPHAQAMQASNVQDLVIIINTYAQEVSHNGLHSQLSSY